MSLDVLLSHWKHDPLTADNIVTWKTTPPRPARTHPFPDDLPAPLRVALSTLGIPSLYSHQSRAWTHTRAGENIVLATGTASGKTLAYNLPVLASLLEDPNARALYLFPTKALTQDQEAVISHQLSVIKPLVTDNWSLKTAIYDGDTPKRDRPAIRKNACILLTNPDMLHTGILPHHTNWADFFRNLKFVVIDELHTYRGVFGSHVANVIRRLKRVAKFYGANPQFILTSATIGNPKELAEKLTESSVTLIDKDGSSRGERHFIIYNPPVVDESIGLRKSSLLESVRLAQDTLSANVQSVVFARSRRSVEIILTYLQESREQGVESSDYSPLSSLHSPVRGYRSGYLPSQRREIESGLRDGTVRTVVATNALELGIDIGGLGAAILVGYPGTVASAWQQAGRAGRGDAPAAALLVASASPLDQFLAHHPEYFMERSPEQALINPDHLLILLEHLRCAMFELPFERDERFGQMDVDEFLEFLVANREAHESNDKFFWMADQYPAANISLRSASPESITLQIGGEKPTTIGTVDGESAAWMVHPGAVYLHEAQSYFVERLDLDQNIALLRPSLSDYYTEPLRETTIIPLSLGEWSQAKGCEKAWGELQITTRVKGFIKRRWYTHETLGGEPLDLPPQDLQTTGYWISITKETVAILSEAGLWTNAPNDYGPGWSQIRERVRARDGYQCQMCGRPELNRQHDVHHKIPFRMFIRTPTSPDVGTQSREILQSAVARANQLDNLTTLCPECHKKAETAVRVRSGLAGLSYVLGNLAPLFLMCDPGDLGTHIEPVGTADFPQPAVVLYDFVPAGIGFSQKLYELHEQLVESASELVSECACVDGCPSCVGPGGENGMGSKQETNAILQKLAISS
ncbi:MAG: DEAD/DEAH box helicase [Anaerolineales bacterium]|nr:DEAD/DEAH box helicase [Anaerolineales bacterium]